MPEGKETLSAAQGQMEVVFRKGQIKLSPKLCDKSKFISSLRIQYAKMSSCY